MESHRLQVMPQHYNVQMFNRIYQQTELLRKKLVYGIDHRRFGLTPEDILSWFDDKFIFAFQKYHDKYDEEVLKGHIIRALQFFKCRVLRAAYTEKYKNKLINIEDVLVFSQIPNEETSQDNNYQLEKLMAFLSHEISPDALFVFKLKLNPPPFLVRKKLKESTKKMKIHDEDILEYLNLPKHKKCLIWLSSINYEIDRGLLKAKKQFKAL